MKKKSEYLNYGRIIAQLVVCVMLFTAYASGVENAIVRAAEKKQFLCVLFYQSENDAVKAMRTTVNAFIKESKKKNVVYFDAPMKTPANRQAAERYGVRDNHLPVVLVIAPNGIVAGGFPNQVTAAQLTQSTSISSLMLGILKSLQEQKIVLLAFQNSKTKFNAESWQAANEIAGDENYKEFITAVKADHTSEDSADLIKQCSLSPDMSEAAIVVLMPPGRIGNIIKGKTTKERLLSVIQSLSSASGCSSGGCGSVGCGQ